MPVRKYIRKNIYRWHRITSLVAALPILLWALSGFLHPVMSSFKPQVGSQFLAAPAIDSKKVQLPLADALKLNGITKLHSFRIVKMDSNYYYQVQELNCDTLSYINCANGKLLKDGDRLYATNLAQRFMSPPMGKNGKPASASSSSHSHQMSADLSSFTIIVHGGAMKSRVTDVELIREFNSEYKSSNVLLPVYKVSFDRSDKIRLYVETSTDRMATAIDNKKAWFIHFFAVAHTWSFLDGLGQGKNLILALFSFLCFLTSVLGFYVYNILKKKKAVTTSKSVHRVLGNIFVLTTALYGITGAWHAVHKFSEPSDKKIIADRSQFSADEMNFSFSDFTGFVKKDEKLSNVSIIKMNGINYWQLFISKGKEKEKRYINTITKEELLNGDVQYGCYLACRFAGMKDTAVMHSSCLNEFNNRYSMMNKRLPVIEVGFEEGGNYYVETSTGHLAAVSNSYDGAERFSFSNLHMHHYAEHWLGKGLQKTILIFSTLGLLVLALTGILIWAYKKMRNKTMTKIS